MRRTVTILMIAVLWGTTTLKAQLSFEPNSQPAFTSAGSLSALSEYPFIDDLAKEEAFHQFFNKIKQKASKYRSEKGFAKYLFYKVHRKFLTRYQAPSTMEDLFSRGTYDCLTATALFSYIFTELGFSHHIVETTYHIYLMLEVDGGDQVMLESTNPLEGFIMDPGDIARLQMNIAKADESAKNSKNTFQHKFKAPIHNQIGLKELKGLYYYNLALDYYNQRRLHLALPLVKSGLQYYPSPRLVEVYRVMVITLLSDPLVNPVLKSHYKSEIEAIEPKITAFYNLN